MLHHIKYDWLVCILLSVTALTTQMAAMSKKIEALAESKVQQVAYVCELCAGAHPTEYCAINPESVQYLGSYNRPPQPYQNAYNPGWKNHPGFSWSNNTQTQNPAPRSQNPLGFQNQAPQHTERKPSLEESLARFITASEKRMNDQDKLLT